MHHPDIEKGIYPFKGVKLERADVEWLLATHKSGGKVGPVDWDDVTQRKREGLDLRGADISMRNLAGLPLARTMGGLTGSAIDDATPDQRLYASIDLHGAQLRYTRLQGAALTHAQLGGANMVAAHFEAADLYGAHFESEVPADLGWAYFDSATRLDRVTLGNARGMGPRVAGTYWNGVDLTLTDWATVKMLGDEVLARNGPRLHEQNRGPGPTAWLHGYQRAVQANRQLSAALRSQGLGEEADRFTYRGQKLQRQVFWRQRKVGGWLFSLLLAALSGYGYRLGRILFAYGLALVVFAGAYFTAGQWFGGTHLAWYESFLVSLTAIHGRVFFSQFGLDSLQSWVAAVESVVGIVIEGVFVAMLIQRFFSR